MAHGDCEVQGNREFYDGVDSEGSVLRGRFDGASRQPPSLLEIHFSRLFTRGRYRDDESEAREIHFPTVRGKL